MIDSGLSDDKNNAWTGTFKLGFRVVNSASVGAYDLPRSADIARFGQLLLVATSESDLQVIDVSDPQVPRPYLGVEKGFELTLAASVRRVEVDEHGFIYFVGGGVSSHGVLKVLDLLALDPSAASGEASATANFAAAQRLSIPISNPVPLGNHPIPEGLPRRVAVASHDLTPDEGILSVNKRFDYRGTGPRFPGSDGSPHSTIRSTLPDSKTVVGGNIRPQSGKLLTDEMSGHYSRNWTPEIRARFVDS